MKESHYPRLPGGPAEQLWATGNTTVVALTGMCIAGPMMKTKRIYVPNGAKAFVSLVFVSGRVREKHK